MASRVAGVEIFSQRVVHRDPGQVIDMDQVDRLLSRTPDLDITIFERLKDHHLHRLSNQESFLAWPIGIEPAQDADVEVVSPGRTSCRNSSPARFDDRIGVQPRVRLGRIEHGLDPVSDAGVERARSRLMLTSTARTLCSISSLVPSTPAMREKRNRRLSLPRRGWSGR